MKYYPISQIKPNPNNPRVIKDRNFNTLVESIKKFPQMRALRPIIINQDFTVIGGNQRLKAFEAAGFDLVWCIQVDLSEEKQKEFIIKDNLHYGEWNYALLTENWEKDFLKKCGIVLPKLDEEKIKPLMDKQEFSIIVECTSETERKNLLDRLQTEGVVCKSLI